MVAAEGAEAAPLDADVGEVDVSVDHVGDEVSDSAASEFVGHHLGGVQFQPRGFEEGDRLLDGYVLAFEGVGQRATCGEVNCANKGFQ